MKRLSLLFFAAILLINTSCKKENKDSSPAGLEGVWELRSITAMLSSTYPPGNGHIISFTNNKYEIRDNGQITRSGEFQIIEDLTAAESTCLNIAPGKYTSRIIYDNNISGTKAFLEISGNILTIVSGCFAIDAGSSSAYERH
ncbi:MAG TPA: hypothetical protein VGQ04_13735 [Chitinophagaceae bacterium]|jgi:hypothetical protein|nr:hypothetical protein [Chitinophagaceae bacterium]